MARKKKNKINEDDLTPSQLAYYNPSAYAEKLKKYPYSWFMRAEIDRYNLIKIGEFQNYKKKLGGCSMPILCHWLIADIIYN